MNLIVLLALVGIGAVSVNGTNTRVVTATVGKSIRLDFDYDGSTYVRYSFFKDRKYFRADRRRIFQRLGRIYFSKVTESDSGVYQMIVRGNKVYYKKAIVLKGKNNSIINVCILLVFCIYVFYLYSVSSILLFFTVLPYDDDTPHNSVTHGEPSEYIAI